MKRFSAQFKKQSESITMRASERMALKERLVSYMEYHPLPADVRASAPVSNELVLSEPFYIVQFKSLYVRGFAGAFAVFMLVSVPVLAEKAVPGDVLYPVKVQFNEEVRASLALSPYQKVAWETERMERRIAEARLLANEGKLTQETQDQVALAVKEHSDAAQREIASLRESDSDEAAIAEITLASALAVQSEVLESHTNGVGEGENTDGRSIAAIAQVVAEARTSTEASQQQAKPSYDRLLARIEEESTNAYELFESVRKSASDDEVKNIERRLQDIERKIAKAEEVREKTSAVSTEVSLSTEGEEAGILETATSSVTGTTPAVETLVTPTPEDEAIGLLRATLMDIHKLINYLTHIEVRQSVSIEELVPLTLSDDEMRSDILSLLDTTIALQEKVAAKEPSAPRREKVEKGLVELQSKLSDGMALLQLEVFNEALVVLKEAHLIATDLDRLTAEDPLRESTSPAEVQSDAASTTPLSEDEETAAQ